MARRIARVPAKPKQYAPTAHDIQRFLGPWIGETMDAPDREAHLWTISEAWGGRRLLSIRTTWEMSAAAGEETYLCAVRPLDGYTAFEMNDLPVPQPFGIAVLVDASHFIIPFWDDEHDVVFSRPGVAELTAHAVCRTFCETAAYKALRRKRNAVLRSAAGKQA
jgi:hypothetical protein